MIAGPNSPLVLLGDTTQDGVWYRGHTYDVLGLEFGDKPFDPFVNLPDGDNEDDEWVFPLADPFDYVGNDIIDARNLLACDERSAPERRLHGLRRPGQRHDLRQPDRRPPGGRLGRRHDPRRARRRPHLRRLRRQRRHPHAGLTITPPTRRPRPTIDLSRTSGSSTTAPRSSPAPSPVPTRSIAGRDLIYGEGRDRRSPADPRRCYDDIIFGDHGAVDPERAAIRTCRFARCRRSRPPTLESTFSASRSETCRTATTT